MRKIIALLLLAGTTYQFLDQYVLLDTETVDIAVAAGEQPTPRPGVEAGLRLLNPQPNEVLVDFGCGRDARWSVAAVRDYGLRQVIGIEIDSDIAESARQQVIREGLSDRIEIVTGDATAFRGRANIGVAYLWPSVLAQLVPQIEKLDRFVSYGFPVPGLQMAEHTLPGGGKVYLWTRPATTSVPITRTVSRIVGLPSGSWCQVCGRYCSNPMAHVLENQIVGMRPVARPPTTQPRPVKAGYALLDSQTPVATSRLIVVEFYGAPGCRPCNKFTDDWKSGKFPDIAFQAKGVWEGETHPIFRWHDGEKWVWLKSYVGPEWLDREIKESIKE